MIKPLILLIAWFAGGAVMAVALFLVFAPFIVSVLSNIGRRPVMPQPAHTHRQRSLAQ
ncbi:MAG TPA: hypothetical protein VFV70_00515 [Hyphomonadaceae bacterium]|nr:hypothetical protein [Hyphomonadaceae bacterium]